VAVSALARQLRITNESEYRAWREGLNGLSRATGTLVAKFGVINLLGPRSRQQRPGKRARPTLTPCLGRQTNLLPTSVYSSCVLVPFVRTAAQFWNDVFTFVQLRFEFVNGHTGEPRSIGRTFVTFYDLDVGTNQVSNQPTVECIQIAPQHVALELSNDTQLISTSNWSDVLSSQALAAMPSTVPGDWQSSVYRASTFGVGEDNPVHVTEISSGFEQKNSAVMVMLEQITSFQVRFGLAGCCTTGRNLLYGGHLLRPICPGGPCDFPWLDPPQPPPLPPLPPPLAPPLPPAPPPTPLVCSDACAFRIDGDCARRADSHRSCIVAPPQPC
jgi:hypothetical protein